MNFRERVKAKFNTDETDENEMAVMEGDDKVSPLQYHKEEEKSSFRESFKKIRMIIGEVNFEIGWYFDLLEKIYKVFNFREADTSELILKLLVVAWLVVTFVPIRPFVALGIINKFITESRFYKRRYVSNYECSIIAIRNFYHEIKLHSF